MSEASYDLRELLLEEVARHARDCAGQPDLAIARRVAHSLKGTFAVASEREVADAFARIERRLAAGDPDAREDLQRLLTMTEMLLSEGRPLPSSTWPEPPHDLAPTSLRVDAQREYLETVRDRLARIDAALSSALTPEERVREIYREIHTIKGAALSTGDEVMAWFCHGLEERLRRAGSREETVQALDEVETHRGIVEEIATAPSHALASLRVRSSIPLRPSQAPVAPLPLPPRRPALENTRESEGRGLGDGTVRVSSAVLDGMFEGALQLSQLKTPLFASAAALAARRRELAQRGSQLREALRLIGPPRPWGAPARAIELLRGFSDQIVPVCEDLQETATMVEDVARKVAQDADELTARVHSLRTSPVSYLFERAAASALAEARNQDREIVVERDGGELAVDRKLMEGLVDPLRQIVRNSVVHGIEPVDERRQAEKPVRSTLRLHASQELGTLRIVVEDDGRGVDPQEVRTRAMATRLLPATALAAMTDAEVVELLFFPGFSLRDDADLAAGRGVGLDLVHAAVERLGGTIHLQSRPGRGLITTLTFPAEGSLTTVVWLEAGGKVVAVPLRAVGRVFVAGEISALDDGKLVVPLAALTGGGPAPCADADGAGYRHGRLAVEIGSQLEGEATVLVTVDDVGAVEEVAVRQLPPLARLGGPYAAAVAHGDALRLVLDPVRLVIQGRRRRRRLLQQDDGGGA
jgi:two-component system, chemotaxis family, sensor kinase CheA